MGVIATVTGVTRCWRCDFCDPLDLVTAMAMSLHMGTRQWKLRTRIVVETPLCPFSWIVATTAAGAQSSNMKFILMAPHTSPWRLLELARFVTRLAFYLRVAPVQWETRQIVIKQDIPAPIGFIVTLLTARSQLAFVGVFLFMAINAAHRQLILV